MSKINKLIILLILFIPFIVLADSAKVVSILPRCVYVSNNKITIPVEVISQNEGNISNVLPRYLLGSITNNDYDIEVELDKKYNEYELLLEKNDNTSDLYFKLKEALSSDRDYKKLDKVMEFNIIIKLNDNIPNKINILGTDIILSKDKDSCKRINNYNMKNINCKTSYLNDNNYSYIMIIGILIIIIIFLWKRSDLSAIHKSKNK